MSLPVIPAAPRAKIRPSRMSRRRAAVLIALNVLMVVHVLQWLWTGRTITPIEPSETMFTLERGELNMGFIFFCLALLATLVLGRWVCGWGCHVVALQDLCGWMMKKAGITPKPFRSRVLVFVPLLAALYMFVWPSFYRAFFIDPPHDKFPPLQPHLTTDNFWATFAGPIVAVPFLLICGFATVYFLGNKGFCTYCCPYGGFFGVLDKLSPGRIRVTDACHQCGHCTAVCTSNVKVHEEVRLYQMVVDPGCMKCMDCVSVCPNDALYFGYGKPALLAKARPMDNRTRLTRAAPPRAFSIGAKEEVFAVAAFAAAFFAVRGVYDTIPFLMALGIAAVFMLAAVKTLHILTRPNASVQTIVLKSGSRFRRPAYPWLGLFAVTAALIAHCGFIRWNEWSGRRAFHAIPISEKTVLSGGDWQGQISSEITGRIREVRGCFDRVDRYGLMTTAEAKLKLSWACLLSDEPIAASAYLEQAAAVQSTVDRGRTHMYLGFVSLLRANACEAARQPAEADALRRRAQEQFAAALASDGELAKEINQLATATALNHRLVDGLLAWNAIVTAQPKAVDARRNLARGLVAAGRLDEAVKHFRAALDTSPGDAETHFQLGMTLAQAGREEEAEIELRKAAQIDPRFAPPDR